jgi:hypothetical protein
LGHSTTAITQRLYQHVRRAVDRGAADAVLELLPKRKGGDGARQLLATLDRDMLRLERA